MSTRTRRERRRLELAHEELCTALTVLRTNVDLVATQMERDPSAERSVLVVAHLGEVNGAVDRLEVLAHRLRAWRGPRMP